MHLNKILFAMLTVTILSTQSFAVELKTLKTKQALKNIRYLSTDGKYSYYTRRSGELLVSTNYDSSILISAPKHTDYHISTSNFRQKILIEVMPENKMNLNFLKNNDLYYGKYGGTKSPISLGKGINPRLHMKDSIISFYQPNSKSLFIKNILLEKKVKIIKLSNTVNPYFSPVVAMPTMNDVLYTDINPKGYSALLLYSLADKSFKTVYKARRPGVRVEFCMIDDYLYIGEFPYGDVKHGTSIVKLSLYNNADFKENSIIYQSNFSDTGNIICKKNSLLFIKTIRYTPEINLKETEIARLDLRTKKVEVLTDKKFITQMYQMDELVLVPYRGHTFVLEGKSNFKTDEIKKDGRR